MEVAISPELQQFIEQKIRTGSFSSPTEVVAIALELLRIEDELDELDPQKIRAELEVGLEQARQGLSTPLNMQQIKQTVTDRTRSAHS